MATIKDTSADDLLAGTAQNDIFISESGQDVLRIDPGWGYDEVSSRLYDAETSQMRSLTIQFGAGIRREELVFQSYDYDGSLRIVEKATGNVLDIPSFFAMDGQGRQAFKLVFADGVSLLPTEVKLTLLTGAPSYGDDVITGTPGNDFIDGLSGNDTINAGPGNDRISDYRGVNTFRFDADWGRDHVTTWGVGNRIEFGAGVSKSSLRFEVISAPRENQMFGKPRQSLRITQVATANELILEDFFSGNTTTSPVFAGIFFADGSQLLPEDMHLQPGVLTPVADTWQGTPGADVIDSFHGDDVLVAGAGDDQLRGGVGRDTYEGGTGDDVIIDAGERTALFYSTKQPYSGVYGAGGADVYVFNRGDGKDLIADAGGPGETDVIQFGAGISPDEIDVFRVRDVMPGWGTGHVLVFSIRGSNDSISVFQPISEAAGAPFDGYYGRYDGNWSIEEVQFANGAKWGASDIQQRIVALPDPTSLTWVGGPQGDLLQGSIVSDTLNGAGGNDTVIGSYGDDLLLESQGDDVYRFESGWGYDTLDFAGNDPAAMGTNRIEFGAGIRPADIVNSVVVYADPATGKPRYDLYLNHVSTGGYLRIKGFFDADGKVRDAFSGLHFADGSVIAVRNITNGGATSGNDLLDYSKPTVPPGNWGANGLAGNDTLISGLDQPRSFTGPDGEFQYVDRPYTLRGDLGDDRYVSSTGNDQFEDVAGLEQYGSDSVRQYAAGGNDTYAFGLGFGSDTIRDAGGRDEVDVIEFSAGIRASDVHVYQDSRDNLLFKVAGTDDVITVMRSTAPVADGGNWDIEKVRFADGTEWDSAAIKQQIRPGDIVLAGTNAADTVVGTSAHERLVDGLGDDVYVINAGWGQDTIEAENTYAPSGSGGANQIRFGEGVRADDLSWRQLGDSDDLLIGHAASGSKLRVRGYFKGRTSGVYDYDVISFADGTVLDVRQVSALAGQLTGLDDQWQGGNGGDTVSAWAGDDQLSGWLGDDVLRGGLGDDIYLGGAGDDLLIDDASVYNGPSYDPYDFAHSPGGNDTYWFDGGRDQIVDAGGANEVDTLVFTNASARDVYIAREADKLAGYGQGYQLVFRIRDSDDTVKVFQPLDHAVTSGSQDGPEYGGNWNIEQVRFGDGTVWDKAEIAARIDRPLADPQAGLLLVGGAGSQSLEGGEGDDTLDGGAGDDNLVGNGGNDTYRFGAGWGSDAIMNRGPGYGAPETAGLNTIVFGEGVDAGSLSFSAERFSYTPAAQIWLYRETDLFITQTGTENRIHVYGFGEGVTADKVNFDGLHFADGSFISEAEIRRRVGFLSFENDVWAGSAGNDSVRGFDGNDTMDAGRGDDTLWGGRGADVYTAGAGNDFIVDIGGEMDVAPPSRQISPSFTSGGSDTYVFESGFGVDHIMDAGGAQETDVIRFGAGIDADRVKVRRQMETVPDGRVTLVTSFAIEGTDDVIKVYGGDAGVDIRNYVPTGNWDIEEVHFADGSKWDAATLKAKIIAGTASDQTIIGSSASETLLGGLGNDTLLGLGGADTLQGGAGNDVYVLRQDNVGSRVVELAGQGRDVVRADFSIDLAEHVEELDFRGAEAAVRGSGNDLDNVLYGNAAGAMLFGGGGNDVFHFDGTVWRATIGRFNSGLTEAEYQGTNTVAFGPGVSANALTFSNAPIDRGSAPGYTVYGSPHDLTIGLVGTDSVVRIPDFFRKSAEGADLFDGIRLADGTLITVEALRTKVGLLTEGSDVWAGTDAGNDRIAAAGGADTVYGGGGNDTLQGGLGDDLYIGGAGNDVLSEMHLRSRQDDLGMGASTYTFESGGADRYRFEKGFGKDQIIDVGRQGETDVIEFGTGIRAADIRISRETGAALAGLPGATGNRLTFSVTGTQDVIHVYDGFQGELVSRDQADWGIEEVRFADGTVWDAAAIEARISAPPPPPVGRVINGTWLWDRLNGGAGNDTINGQGSGDTLVGGWGNDLLSGGKGSDVYQFSIGDGADTIVENDSTWFNTDQVRISGATSRQLWLTQSDDDLVVRLLGSEDSITIQDWYRSSAHQVERIVAGDGKILTNTRVNALVTAMSAFAPPAAADTTLPPNVENALSQVLAGSWR